RPAWDAYAGALGGRGNGAGAGEWTPRGRHLAPGSTRANHLARIREQHLSGCPGQRPSRERADNYRGSELSVLRWRNPSALVSPGQQPCQHRARHPVSWMATGPARGNCPMQLGTWRTPQPRTLLMVGAVVLVAAATAWALII